MYKVMWLTKFRSDLPRDQVLAWWRGPHAEMAKSTPGMLRYVQSYWVSALDGETQLPTGELGAFDGHAEHWFADEESYRIGMASKEWQRCREDGPNGFDYMTLVGALLEDTVICWEPSEDRTTS